MENKKCLDYSKEYLNTIGMRWLYIFLRKERTVGEVKKMENFKARFLLAATNFNSDVNREKHWPIFTAELIKLN